MGCWLGLQAWAAVLGTCLHFAHDVRIRCGSAGPSSVENTWRRRLVGIDPLSGSHDWSSLGMCDLDWLPFALEVHTSVVQDQVPKVPGVD